MKMAKQIKKTPSTPVGLTQEQINEARKGHSAGVFQAIEKSSQAKESQPKSRPRKKR